MILPIFTPVCNTWNSIALPVITVREPVMIVLPLTSSLAEGVVVPMPTLPLYLNVTLVVPPGAKLNVFPVPPE